MHSVLSAEGAVLVELQTLGGVALVLVGVVVTLLALGTTQSNLDTATGFRHTRHLLVEFAVPNKKRRNGHDRFQRFKGRNAP